MRKLNFLSIEYFLKVAETLNFTVAARELYISQPALSKQIRQLEEELGIKLLKRDTKQVEMTEGGRILYREWSDMVRRSEKAIGAAKNAEEKQTEKIRVGIVEFGGVIDTIAPVMEQFTEADNNMEVIYEVHGFSQLRKMLDNDEVDMIFSLNTEVPVEKRNVYTQVIYDMELCIVVPPKNHFYGRETLKVSQLKDETIYIFSDAYSEAGRKSIMAHFAKEGVSIHRMREFPNIRSMEMGLINGDGVTIGYRSFFEQTDKFHFFPIRDEIGLHQLIAAWKVENEKQVHELLQFCSEQHIVPIHEQKRQ